MASDLFEIKMAMHSWRQTTKETLMSRIEEGSHSDEDLVKHYRELSDVGILLHNDEMANLNKGHRQTSKPETPASEAFMNLIARRGAMGKVKSAILSNVTSGLLQSAGPLEHPDLVGG